MAVTYASFVIEFPELADAGQPLIEAKIAGAELRVGADVWPASVRDQGVLYRAAHMLALSPYGAQAKMVSKSGETTYGKQYESLVQEIGAGFLVLP